MFALSGFWEIAPEVLGLLLSVITVVFIIKFNDEYNIKIWEEIYNDNRSKKGKNIIDRVLKSRFERSINEIDKTMNKERNNLQGLIDNENRKIKKNSVLGSFMINDRRSDKNNIDNNQIDDNVEHNRYALIGKMVNKGMGVRDISEKIKMPMGEIEFFLKINGLNDRAHMGSGIGAQVF